MTAPIRSRLPHDSLMRRALISLARQSLPVDEPEALGEIIAEVLWHEELPGGLEANAGALKQKLDEIRENCRKRHDPAEREKAERDLLAKLKAKYE